MSGLDPGTVVAGSGGGAAGTVSSTVGLLHNKVDKMVRLMVETSENQKKMNKVLQDLLKVGVVSKTEVNNSVGGGGEAGRHQAVLEAGEGGDPGQVWSALRQREGGRTYQPPGQILEILGSFFWKS